MSFNDAVTYTLEREGAFSNHAADRGGATMYGITEAVARGQGYTGPMGGLTKAQAIAIYKALYWDGLNLTLVDFVAPTVANELFDTAVNCGVGFAGKAFQRVLNSLNRGGTVYPDLTVDGDVGQKTAEAFAALISKRGVDAIVVMYRALNCLQGAHYISISESRPANEAFTFGWFKNRVN